MRELTSTLTNAQKQATAVPYVKVEAVNKVNDVIRQDWARLYAGSEPDYYHALTVPSDGSLIRARITPPSDSRKLYRQRVASPGPESDFSQWTYTNQYNAVVVAVASLGAEVSIFWINTSREVRRIKSTDYGASWGSSELLDSTPTTAIYGLAAAYKPGGDLAIFFADQSTLYVKKNISGQWQSKAAWDKTTGDLSGVAATYDGDWEIMVTGKDASGNYRLWSLVYGDGGEVAAGSWSALQEIAAAPSEGDFEYRRHSWTRRMSTAVSMSRNLPALKRITVRSGLMPFPVQALRTDCGGSRCRSICHRSTAWRWPITVIMVG